MSLLKASIVNDSETATNAGDQALAAIDVAALHIDLQRASTMDGDPIATRQEFRRIVLKYTAAVGVGHVIQDEGGCWDLRPNLVTGRLPRRNDFVERFAKCCTTTITRNTIQLEQFLGLEAIYVPVSVGTNAEVLLVLTEENKASQAIFVLEVVSAYFGLWLKGNLSDSSNWKLTSLAALVELVSDIERATTRAQACQITVNELARYLSCSHVAIGTLRRGKIQLATLSGAAQLDDNSDAAMAVVTLLTETILRDGVSIWPPREHDWSQLLLGHAQLAREFQVEAVLSSPLRTPDGELMGAILLAGERDLVQGDRLPNFVRASMPRVASAMRAVGRAERSVITRAALNVRQYIAGGRGRVAIACAVLALAILMLPFPYRVRCDSIAEATRRRFAVAPFQGLVEHGYVRPGDLVVEGDILARMDAQPIRLELASVVAKREQARKKREMALAARDVPKSLLAELEAQELSARIQLLERQQDQFEIRSPIRGVVLSGSLERSEAASVELGQVLFEVGPLRPLKINVLVPSDEIVRVRTGQKVRVWMDGLGHQTLTATVQRIHPRSEMRDSRNVFVVECLIANDNQRLRPGMSGHARIDTAPQPLIWNLLHKPWQYVVSRLTWW